LLSGHAVVLLPGVFTGGLSTWADFLGFSGVVSLAPVSKMHNFDVSGVKVLEVGMGGSIKLLEVGMGGSVKLLELLLLEVGMGGSIKLLEVGMGGSVKLLELLLLEVGMGGSIKLLEVGMGGSVKFLESCWLWDCQDWGSSHFGLGWNLPDSEFDISFNWDSDFLIIVELSESRHGAFSSGTSSSESLVNSAIWDSKLEAESVFDPVNWSDGNGVEVLEV
jgi:hypothetical protein